jgi:aldehyde:ferredoxin oxidoreductase
MLPGPQGELISRKGAVLERDQFEKMMDEYYLRRGWDVKNGLQKKDTLAALGLADVIPRLKAKGLLAE